VGCIDQLKSSAQSTALTTGSALLLVMRFLSLRLKP
jgi:hypothetical protein